MTPRRFLALLFAVAPLQAQLFQPAGTTPLGANTAYALADFNLDGRADLVRAAALTGALTVSFGVGDGSFTTPSASVSLETTTALIPGDFDHDGKTDLAVLSAALFAEPAARILLGSGSGTFTARPALVLQTLARAGVAGDFDQDGNLDLAIVVTNAAGATTITVLRGNGRGDLAVSLLSAPVVLPIPSAPVIGDVQAVDLNGDRKLDVVMTVNHSSGAGLAFAIGDGRGSFTGSATMGNQPTLSRPTARMAVADFNGDRNPDVVMFGYVRDQVTLWLNSNGVLVPQSSSFPFGTNPYAIATADFDLDGRTDFALARQGELNVALGTGFGSFIIATGSPFAVGGPTPVLEGGDFNGDRRPDLLIQEGNADVFRTLLNAVPRPPTLQTQTIQFDQPDDRGLNEGNLTLAASATSGLPVAFASLTNPVCTVAKGIVTMVTTGTCTILAIQAGDQFYSPAPTLQRSFTVARNLQTITFAALADRVLDASPFTVTATSSAGLTVTFTASPSNICSVTGTSVRLIGLGQCSITASQAGNATFPAAVSVTRTFTVTAVAVVGPRVEAIANAASYAIGTLAPASYGVLFGQRLTGGVLRLRDAAGATLTPELIFSGETQINFIVPAGVARGSASITVTTPNGASEFPVTIAATAPGMFSANGTGQGLAAAQALIVNADKSITTLTVGNGPIPVRAGTEVYLVLYGTGIRGRSPAGIFASVGGAQVEVLYAGPQGTFPALDQVNLRVPLTVALGVDELRVVVDGALANVVTAVFQ